MLLQQEHLDRISAAGFEPHIYLVCRRPRVGLDPASITFTPERIRGRFFIQRQDRQEFVEFDSPHSLGSSKLTVECPYPYSEFRFRTSAGAILSHGKTSLLVATLGQQYWRYLDLEVLYIGQAYGRDGTRTASQRLIRHETLQGIYAEALRRSPDQEIWIVVTTFEDQMFASFDGISKTYGTTQAEDDAHIEQVVAADITERQKINFTEAALIRYFQPPYNTLLKDTFPNPAHSTYSECYDLDLNAVSTEIDTEEIGCRLWSETIAPQWVHVCMFPLHSRDERMSMFEVPPKPKGAS